MSTETQPTDAEFNALVESENSPTAKTIEKLERENARLKARGDHWQQRSDTADYENARLRELLKAQMAWNCWQANSNAEMERAEREWNEANDFLSNVMQPAAASPCEAPRC